MATEAPTADYVDLAQRILLESIARAAAEHRHGSTEIVITFYAGEIRQVQEVNRTTHKT